MLASLRKATDEGVDISVVVGELPDSSLVARRLGCIRWVMGASPYYLNRAGRPVTPADLSGHDCLVYSQERFADQWTLQQAAQSIQVRVQVRMRSNTLDGVVTAAVMGAGIVLAPAWALSQYVEQGELELVLRDYELPPRPVSVVLTHNRLLASKVRTLVDFLANRLERVSFDYPL